MVATPLLEIPLQGGDVTAGVVRVGDTVRRPAGPATPAVHALLRHLEAAGFEGAPRVVGVDELGREILTYVPGSSGVCPATVTDEFLAALAVLLRRYHDATAGFPLAQDGWAAGSNDDRPPEVVGHCDVTPQNVIFRDGGPVAFIDFDLARPTTRLFDVVTTLRHWAPIADPVDRHPLQRGLDVGARLRLFCDAYGVPARDRRRLLDLARLRFHRSYAVMRDRAAAAQRSQGGDRGQRHSGADRAAAQRDHGTGRAAAQRNQGTDLAAAQHNQGAHLAAAQRSDGTGWAAMWAGGAGERIRRAAAWLDVHEDELHAPLV
ncbi:aminoglycoside phosphotransferase family protein [Nonomuraea pusilla]|uniref:aminoglycoside phosphotransferase family protein n=1 Tax=Nonomuraea pusilla TaxID=46177 RepID=UPI00331BBD4C